MTKRQNIQISIPNPCQEPWAAMTPNAQGRFCSHCQQTIIDFTNWSDADIYRLLTKKEVPPCGRFRESQLNRTITIPYQPESRLYRLAIALGLTLICTQIPHLLAQTRPPKIEQNGFLTKNPVPADSPSAALKGRIVDEKGEPMNSAVIQLSQNGILKGGTVTDFDGYYEINTGHSGLYDILVLYQGYDSVLMNAVLIAPDTVTVKNVTMNSRYHRPATEFKVWAGRPQIIHQEVPTKKTFTKEEINQMPH